MDLPLPHLLRPPSSPQYVSTLQPRALRSSLACYQSSGGIDSCYDSCYGFDSCCDCDFDSLLCVTWMGEGNGTSSDGGGACGQDSRSRSGNVGGVAGRGSGSGSANEIASRNANESEIETGRVIVRVAEMV